MREGKLNLFQLVGQVRCPVCGHLYDYRHWYTTCPNCKAEGIVMHPGPKKAGDPAPVPKAG